MTDVESRAALLLGPTAVGQLRNAGIAVVDAERLAKLEKLKTAIETWKDQVWPDPLPDGLELIEDILDALRHMSGNN